MKLCNLNIYNSNWKTLNLYCSSNVRFTFYTKQMCTMLYTFAISSNYRLMF